MASRPSPQPLLGADRMMSRPGQDRLLSPLCLWGIVVAYVTINALTQRLVSGTAELDQSQQLLFSQDWQFGYSPQPPLYTWLVLAVFAITGPSLSALLGIKVVLLSSLAGILIGVGRQFSFSKQQHLITIVSMVFILQFIWESQRDLTHSVLVTVMSAATLLQIVRAQRNPITSNYIILGLLVGMGVISKYNYALFLLALITTAIFTRQYLRMIMDYRILISIAIGLAVAAPHVIWLLDNTDIALGSAHKLGATAGNRFSDVGRVALNFVAFLTPLWILSLFLLGGRRYGQGTNQSNDRVFIVKLFAVMMVIVVIFVLATGAQQFQDRWFQPLLFFVPLLIALLARPSQNGLRIYCSIGASVALMVAIALPLKNVVAGYFDFNARRNIPYPTLARSLAATIGEPVAIFSETDFLAGNMRTVFRRARIITPSYEGQPVSDSGMRIVLCETSGCQNDEFRDWISKRYGIDVSSLKFNQLEEPYYYIPTRKHTLYWAKVDASPPGS